MFVGEMYFCHVVHSAPNVLRHGELLDSPEV